MQAQYENERQSRWVAVLMAAATVAISLLLVFSLYAPGSIAGLIVYPPPARGHATHVPIESGPLPPVGGVHAAEWQNCGVFVTPIGAENAVHALEHGAVWITTREDLDPTRFDQLAAIVRSESFLMLSPYPGQAYPIVLSAWGIQLPLDDASDLRLRQFINRYRLGPTAPERGAACEGGVGEPLP